MTNALAYNNDDIYIDTLETSVTCTEYPVPVGRISGSFLANVNSSSGWLFTNVCRTYATTDVVRPTAYLRYDLFTTSVANL